MQTFLSLCAAAATLGAWPGGSLTSRAIEAAPPREEIALFDRNGRAAAYIDTEEELTIYLWGGKPVAYLEVEGDAFSIYGFNGKHLGWFEDGIVRDHDGDAVGFVEGAVAMATQFEPFKGFKQFKPFRAFKAFAPFKPYYTREFSSVPLSVFLSAGAN